MLLKGPSPPYRKTLSSSWTLAEALNTLRRKAQGQPEVAFTLYVLSCSLLFFLKDFLYVYVYVTACAHEDKYLQRPEEDMRFPGDGVTGSGKPLNIKFGS